MFCLYMFCGLRQWAASRCFGSATRSFLVSSHTKRASSIFNLSCKTDTRFLFTRSLWRYPKKLTHAQCFVTVVILNENVCPFMFVRILNDSLLFIVILKVAYYLASAGTAAKAVNTGNRLAFNSIFFSQKCLQQHFFLKMARFPWSPWNFVR